MVLKGILVVFIILAIFFMATLRFAYSDKEFMKEVAEETKEKWEGDDSYNRLAEEDKEEIIAIAEAQGKKLTTTLLIGLFFLLFLVMRFL